MSNLVVLIGLPASGKTTHARTLVNQGYARVNKDDLRVVHPEARESEIHKIQMEIMHAVAKTQQNIVIDNTNLNPRTRNYYRQFARDYGYTYHEVKFNAAISDLIKRDEEREKRVGRDVIMTMALRWDQINLGRVIAFDLDGTLSLGEHRQHYLQETPKNWKAFFEALGGDTLNEPVAIAYRAAEESPDVDHIVCISGRPEEYRELSRTWLRKHGLNPTVILMRRTGDRRPDDIVKQELYRDHLANNAKVLAIYDDRNSVVKMWRSIGLTCFQVAEGDF